MKLTTLLALIPLGLSAHLESVESDETALACTGLCCEAWTPAAPDGPLVELRTTLGQSVLAPDRASDVFVTLAMQAAEPADLPPRPPLNLALVIDRSSSMAAAGKLDYAKQAAALVAARMAPTDRIAVVAYDNEVQTVWPSTPLSASVGLREAIDSLQPRGSTNLEGGMQQGCREVYMHRTPDMLNRVLLLSDGLANVGKQTAAELGREASHARELGLNISTIGLGLQYDEEVMAAIATEAGGRYRYAREAESLAGFLNEELDHAGRVVARAALLEFELGIGVEAVELYGNPFHVDPVTRTVRVPLEDFVAGERRQLLLKLRVQPGTVGAGRMLVGPAKLTYVERGASSVAARPLVQAPRLSARWDGDLAAQRASQDRRVSAKLEVVRAALFMDTALAKRQAGDWRGAASDLGARAEQVLQRNAQTLGCRKVDQVAHWMQRRAADMTTAADNWESGRDVDLGGQLEAMGYL